MKFFGNKTRSGNLRQEELADRIAKNIIRWQTRIAGYLNNRAKGLSEKARLYLLILFCVLFATLNIYLVIRSISS